MRHGQRGATLVEALVALVLLAGAAAVVAAAATASLRAIRRAVLVERATALAARTLAAMQTGTVVPGTTTEPQRTPDLDATVERSALLDPGGATIALAVTVDAGPPPVHVRLATRRVVRDGVPEVPP